MPVAHQSNKDKPPFQHPHGDHPPCTANTHHGDHPPCTANTHHDDHPPCAANAHHGDHPPCTTKGGCCAFEATHNTRCFRGFLEGRVSAPSIGMFAMPRPQQRARRISDRSAGRLFWLSRKHGPRGSSKQWPKPAAAYCQGGASNDVGGKGTQVTAS